ncbi:MAG: ABC transporter ATP-binding protein, partial [Candidatus Omnitrophota bacterium]|nr:ABC transporter ATP-binding protein [Candidatus Omnitrophota bacterium]
AVVGPSGGGKSTLLNLLGTLDEPSAGRVVVDGVDVSTLQGDALADFRRAEIGFIFQLFNLVPILSALENVMLPALIKLKGSKVKKLKVKKQAVDLLEIIGLKHRVNHRPFQLSGGEQQRIAVARALINNPDIVFCDEPTGNLDSKNGDLIYNLIRQLNKEKGQTFVIVTHEEAVSKRVDQVYRIRDGKLI